MILPTKKTFEEGGDVQFTEETVNRATQTFSQFMTRVFLMMFVGLAITMGVAVATSYNADMLNFVIQVMNGGTFWLFLIVYLLLSIGISYMVSHVNVLGAGILFVVYAAMTGFMFSTIGLVYDTQSIWQAFLATGLMCGLLAAYGAITKRDVSKIGPILFIGLVSILVLSVLNSIFFHNPNFSLFITIVGIVVFGFYVVFDVNQLKRIYAMNLDNESMNAIAIGGALSLYLDFINLFIRLLSLFGRRRD